MQFLVLGAGIFLLFGIIGERQDFTPDEIIVSAGQIERMTQAWRKTRMRPPTKAELEGLIEDYVQEEIYYREAVALGLDQDNSIIRRHLRQKMEFLSEDIAAQKVPEEKELQAFLDRNPELFTQGARLSFRHVYFNRDMRGAATDDAALEGLAMLLSGESETATRDYGDPLMFPGEFELATEREIGDWFGKTFIEQLLSLSTGQWSGPVESGFGLHLVFVEKRIDLQVPPLPAIRAAVVREWREARRQELNAAFYDGLLPRYSVVIERPDWLEANLNIANVVQR